MRLCADRAVEYFNRVRRKEVVSEQQGDEFGRGLFHTGVDIRRQGRRANGDELKPGIGKLALQEQLEFSRDTPAGHQHRRQSPEL